MKFGVEIGGRFMLRIILVLAACAFAEEARAISPDTTIHQDSTQAPVSTVIRPPEGLTASDYAKKAGGFSPLFAPDFGSPGRPKTQSDYLTQAGTHWLISIGIAAATTGILYATDFEADGASAILIGTGYAAALGFTIAVPVDLILAGKAPVGRSP